MDGFYTNNISVSNILKIPSCYLIITFDRYRACPAHLPTQGRGVVGFEGMSEKYCLYFLSNSLLVQKF